ncbi:MAG: InlB B-repeat-containing protein, partial [bacterium]
MIDNRVDSKGDALWDGQHLYVVSQHYTNSPGPAASGDEGRLYRYSYNSALKTYSLDAGFPVIVNNSVSETLVLAKDSTGKLWVTWTEGGKVKVNRSLGNDLTWGTPFDLPVQGTDSKIDDISSILAFGGNKIGILWSNQNDKKSYFAMHLDGNADEMWEPKEQALADAALGAVSYDHINLKPACDNDGNVYAATKTNLTQSGKPLVYLLKRTAAGVWTRHIVSTVDEGYIRPIVLIDGSNLKIYVFATSEASTHRSIYMKSSDLSNIAFPSGLGTLFIQSATDTVIMNPTSTKQCLNGATGLLVLAADQHTRFYLHNYLDLSGGASQFALTASTIGSGSVTMNPPGGGYSAGTMVTLTATPNSGYQFSGWSGNLSGSTNPATITMDGNKNVTATFTANQYNLTVNTVGSGSVTLDPPGGTYNTGTVVTLTATPNPDYQFDGWGGDLSGSTNPATITMDGNKNITATFTEIPSNGQIVHKEIRTGGSSNSTAVATSANLAGVNGHLYLAAISMQPRKSVVAVSGLGLSWTLVKTQCSGQNTIAVEVWMAQGTPSGNGVVTAILASAPSSAVIAV